MQYTIICILSYDEYVDQVLLVGRLNISSAHAAKATGVGSRAMYGNELQHIFNCHKICWPERFQFVALN